MTTIDQYREAGRVLWGAGGVYAVDEYVRLNQTYFAGELPPVPIVVGITAYGRCIGLTRHEGDWKEELPRITLASNLFGDGPGAVSDVLLHEMIHVKLILAGLDSAHNGKPWCAEVERLSPIALGLEVNAKPIHPRRVDGKNVRLPLDGHLARKQLAYWPQSLRASKPGAPISIASY